MPSRASRTGAFLSRGAVRKWLSCRRRRKMSVFWFFVCFFLAAAAERDESVCVTHHPVSSWEKLLKVVKAWWGHGDRGVDSVLFLTISTKQKVSNLIIILNFLVLYLMTSNDIERILFLKTVVSVYIQIRKGFVLKECVVFFVQTDVEGDGHSNCRPQGETTTNPLKKKIHIYHKIHFMCSFIKACSKQRYI